VLNKFLAQDIEMIESEQRNYLANPQRRYVEINPAIIAIQRLIVQQYEQFVQKSSQSPRNGNQEFEKSISLSKTMPQTGLREVITSAQADLTKENTIG
jgi:hypothetical protein